MYKKIQRIVIDKEPITNTWSAHILSRSISKEELKDLWVKYKSARLRTSTMGNPPTKLQYKITELRKGGMTPRDIRAQFKLKEHEVGNAITKVAIYQLLTT